MKHSSRNPLLLAFVAGVLLIAFGLLRSSGEGASPAAATVQQGGRQPVSSEAAESLVEAGGSMDLLGPLAPSSGEIGAAGDGRETSLKVLVSYSPDGAPVVGAHASLWRQQTGEGPSFRPARRLTELVTGPDGRVRFVVTPNSPLEVHARAAGISGSAAIQVAPIQPGEERSIALTLERPPEPLELAVRDAVTGDPIAGVAIRSVTTDPALLGLEDFPGTTQLVKRTDATGRANLPGVVREAHWIIIDAAGYSPATLAPDSLDGRLSADVQLERSARLSIEAVDSTNAPLDQVVVTCEVSLGGYRTTFTAKTNRRGEASLSRVPVGVPMVPMAALPDSIPIQFDAITMMPAEERTLRLELSGQ